MNTIIRYSGYSKIITCKGEEILVDNEDLPKVIGYSWRYKNGKVSTRYWHDGKYRVLFISRLIMNLEHGDKRDVDHINHNRLDNRKDNLRICTRSQNIMNIGIRSNNTSGITGVSWSKTYHKWFIQIMINGKRKSAYRESFDEAVALRNEWEERYYKEFRYKEEI